MATYDYQCKECDYGELVTIKKSMTDDSVPDCPNCGNPMMQHFAKRVSVSLKGRGWTGQNLTKRR